MDFCCWLVNAAAGEDVMYQNLGSDTVPTPDRTHKIVVKNADGTYSNKESEIVTPPAPENTTTPPTDETTKTPTDDTTTEPTDNTTKAPDVTTEEPKQNGCGGVSLAATLFTVIVSAFAFVVIKKKN